MDIEDIRRLLPIQSDGLFLEFGYHIAPWLSLACFLAVVVLAVITKPRPFSIYGFLLGGCTACLAVIPEVPPLGIWLWDISLVWMLLCLVSSLSAIVETFLRKLPKLSLVMSLIALLCSFGMFAFLMVLADAAGC